MPTLKEYLYRDYIFVRCDTGYKLMMVRWKQSESHIAPMFAAIPV